MHRQRQQASEGCAADADGGFLVFGITGSCEFDSGIHRRVGHQPIKDWIGALIPKLLEPPVINCQARFIAVPNTHSPDHGVLVIYSPSSEASPHRVKESQLAYLRVGTHSAPISLRTFQDLSSRMTTGLAQIDDLQFWQLRTQKDNSEYVTRVPMNPRVTLLSGPVCRQWQFVLSLSISDAQLVPMSKENNLRGYGSREYRFSTHEPLFPGTGTPVGIVNVTLCLRNPAKEKDEIKCYLNVESVRKNKSEKV
jgi:hypothetical protein